MSSNKGKNPLKRAKGFVLLSEMILCLIIPANGIGQSGKFEETTLQKLVDKDTTQSRKELAAQLGLT